MTVVTSRLSGHAHAIALTANQLEVYADLIRMPLSGNISRNPHLLRLVEEAVGSRKLTEDNLQLECDMGRAVGYSERVATTTNDAVFFARQTKSAGFTRFVKNRQPRGTRYITIDLVRDADGAYELRNVTLGKACPEVPGDVAETESSKDYWMTHAVIFNGQSIIASTLTKDCPY